jgi:hypothetical protein
MIFRDIIKGNYEKVFLKGIILQNGKNSHKKSLTIWLGHEFTLVKR